MHFSLMSVTRREERREEKTARYLKDTALGEGGRGSRQGGDRECERHKVRGEVQRNICSVSALLSLRTMKRD